MIGLFFKGPDVIAAGIPFFRACSLDYLAVSVLFCINGYLNGSEKNARYHGQLLLWSTFAYAFRCCTFSLMQI